VFSFNIGLGQVIRGRFEYIYRQRTNEFNLTKGWDEGFITMKVGEQARLTVTGDYGYGAAGFPAWG
jgi:peptidylprolyl isomerase